ncbi:hypothetical protein DUNSADRAFT_17543 [Dunaliella salina]|uniref:Encoded protein n=1 Tax=Dunaliella salina TaxID=3046 RepID=A0ABQ7H052_DUNSA|nr:hypothetical protein DUNSADRAFT_17543 [Dunaliella salina]|eukprot:KAF5840196.1 hypothetical protein DUNSADRAFT_17543 [Dunaliella salina]
MSNPVSVKAPPSPSSARPTPSPVRPTRSQKRKTKANRKAQRESNCQQAATASATPQQSLADSAVADAVLASPCDGGISANAVAELMRTTSPRRNGNGSKLGSPRRSLEAHEEGWTVLEKEDWDGWVQV